MQIHHAGETNPPKMRELTREELSEKIRALEERLCESEQTIQAIRGGEVDAFIVHEPTGEHIYTLKGADLGYRILVESITEGALILSSDDSIYYCNGALGEILGLPIQKIISKKLDSHVVSGERAQLMELIREGRSFGVAKGEFLMKRNDGTSLPVNISLNRMSFEDFEDICAIITDLTEQKQVEEELRKHRKKLESLVHELQVHQGELKMQNDELRKPQEALHRAHDELEERVRERTAELLKVNEQLRDEIVERKRAEALLQRQAELLHLAYDAIIVWQLGGPIESWNKGAEKLYSYSQEEAVGQFTHDLLKTIHPIPWPQIEAKLHESGFWEGELKHHTRGGQALIISARKQLVRGTDGVERILEVNRDITERKQMEEGLRKSHDELELRVKERTAELELANGKLRLMPSRLIAVQENERKRLAGDLHDSIGQTLAALKFRIEHVISTLEKQEPKQALQLLQEFVPVLQRSIDETRSIYMGLKPTMLADRGVLAALEWYRLEILKVYPNPHIELETSIREEDISEDLKTAVFRIVQEALNNTLKHGKSEWVDVRLVHNDGAIELEISDDGVGMDLDYILESRTAKSLGLMGMRERTEFLGGEFTIKSVPGEGTTVKAIWRNH